MLLSFFEKTDEFKFLVPESTPCMVCSHVLNNNAPILCANYSDNIWQFSCNDSDHDIKEAKIMALGDIVKMDLTINELYEINEKMFLTRVSPEQEWQAFYLS